MQLIPKNIERLHQYWQGLAGGAVPERALFHIEDVLPLLPYLILCDFEFDPFRVHYRLSGTRVDQMTSMNLAGRYLDEFAGGAYAKAVVEMQGYYEAVSRTGIPKIWNYPWAGDNPKLKVIWAGIFPLKVDGVITQCVAIEDYGELNRSDVDYLAPDDPQARNDWGKLHNG